jgi:hypothetical protein
VNVKVEGQRLANGNSADDIKSLLSVYDGTGGVGSADPSTLGTATLTTGDLTNSFDFVVTYDSTLASIKLSVKYDNWPGFQDITDGNNPALIGNTAQVVGLEFSGATQGSGASGNSVTTDITNLQVNSLSYAQPTLTSIGNQKKTHYIYVDCTTPGAITITGTVTFTWRSATNNLGNRPYFKLALGDPAVRQTLACPP